MVTVIAPPMGLSRVLLPATDLGVLLQVVVLVIVVGWTSWRVRHRPEWRLVVFGLGLLVLGLFGIRAAH